MGIKINAENLTKAGRNMSHSILNIIEFNITCRESELHWALDLQASGYTSDHLFENALAGLMYWHDMQDLLTELEAN